MIGKVESYNIEYSQDAGFMSNITDISFPDIFESLNTGRDSSDRVLQTIIEGLLEGRYQPGERVVARQLAEELGVSIVPVREAIHILAGEDRLKCGFEVLRGGHYRLTRGEPPLAVTCRRCFPAGPRGEGPWRWGGPAAGPGVGRGRSRGLVRSWRGWAPRAWQGDGGAAVWAGRPTRG